MASRNPRATILFNSLCREHVYGCSARASATPSAKLRTLYASAMQAAEACRYRCSISSPPDASATPLTKLRIPYTSARQVFAQRSILAQLFRSVLLAERRLAGMPCFRCTQGAKESGHYSAPHQVWHFSPITINAGFARAAMMQPARHNSATNESGVSLYARSCIPAGWNTLSSYFPFIPAPSAQKTKGLTVQINPFLLNIFSIYRIKDTGSSNPAG